MTLRNLLRTVLGAAALAAIVSAAPASAGSTTFQVSATVARVCTIAATNVSLTYDPVVANASAAATANGTVTVACTRGETYRVSLDNGLNYSGGRRLRLGATGEYLTYDLYQDSGYATTWDGTNQVARTAANRAPVDLTVYASIPGGQDVPVGTYTDTIVADIHL
jgi:spore coat protein U domain-containing protein, fimbrial subunit CupE1/2/3/6